MRGTSRPSPGSISFVRIRARSLALTRKRIFLSFAGRVSAAFCSRGGGSHGSFPGPDSPEAPRSRGGSRPASGGVSGGERSSRRVSQRRDPLQESRFDGFQRYTILRKAPCQPRVGGANERGRVGCLHVEGDEGSDAGGGGIHRRSLDRVGGPRHSQPANGV
jgi:hypothetical protein